MIEHGKRVFYGSMDDFNNYVEPHSIVVSMAKHLVISELNEMKGVNRVDMISERQFRLWYNGKEDTLKKVVEESVKRNWELVEIHAEKSSLEEIFAKLSGKK